MITRKDSANIISFNCLHIHQNYTSQTELEVPTKCFASSSASMHSNFFIWGLHILTEQWKDKKKTKKQRLKDLKTREVASTSSLQIAMTKFDNALRYIILSIQSLQHTPIIICWVLPFWLHIFMTNHGQNVIGQFLVDNFQICRVA